MAFSVKLITVVSRTDANGQTTTYGYDSLNRQTLVTYQNGSKVSTRIAEKAID